MRNLNNAIKKVAEYKGLLSKSIVCGTAKGTLNQYARGWIKPDSETIQLIEDVGILGLLEEPLKGRKLDKDLTKAGKEWLNTFFFTRSGARRNTKDLRYVYEGSFDIIKNFSHFTFAGFQDDGHGTFAPCWKVHAKNGDTFTYCYTGGRFSYGDGLEVWV